MQHYSFQTTWKFPARVEEIWPIIKDIERWPEWWKGVTDVKMIHQGEPDGMGKKALLTWKSMLPYHLTFAMEVTEIIENKKITGYTTGELAGTGTWLFFQEGKNALLQFNWEVKTTRRWMNIMAPVLRPVFKWNHDVVMLWGQQGLGAKLNT